MSRSNEYDSQLDISPTSEPKNSLLKTEMVNSALIPTLAYVTGQITDWRAGIIGGAAGWTETMGTYFIHSFDSSLWRSKERSSKLKNAFYITTINAYCGALNGALMKTSDICFRQGNWNAEVSIPEVLIAAAEGAVTSGVTAGITYLGIEGINQVKEPVMKGVAKLINSFGLRKNNNNKAYSLTSDAFKNEEELELVSNDFNKRSSVMVTQSDLDQYFNTL